MFARRQPDNLSEALRSPENFYVLALGVVVGSEFMLKVSGENTHSLVTTIGVPVATFLLDIYKSIRDNEMAGFTARSLFFFGGIVLGSAYSGFSFLNRPHPHQSRP